MALNLVVHSLQRKDSANLTDSSHIHTNSDQDSVRDDCKLSEDEEGISKSKFNSLTKKQMMNERVKATAITTLHA